MDSANGCQQPMDAEYLLRAEKKGVKNLLFQTKESQEVNKNTC